MNAELVDIGANLTHESFAADREAVLARALEAGVTRLVVTGADLVPNVQFYLATQRFAAENGKAIDALVTALDAVDRWAGQNPTAVAEQLSPAIHIPAPIIATALQRQSYGVTRIDAKVVADQQKVADAFAALNLLPKAVTIADALVRPGL